LRFYSVLEKFIIFRWVAAAVAAASDHWLKRVTLGMTVAIFLCCERQMQRCKLRVHLIQNP
ncbi:MAG: hypothetical protein AAFY17_05610, partial [Cyanobacteria bacterium J06642_11]